MFPPIPLTERNPNGPLAVPQCTSAPRAGLGLVEGTSTWDGKNGNPPPLHTAFKRILALGK
eukprot:349769-Prorocentrum_minimum.AAC.1